MGVAPHVQTEFWLWDGSNFCKDLTNWTNTMIADDNAPNVHSVSYGWQGDLSQIGCDADSVNLVDANFAKLAARGISIIFASGDSGSGYVPPRPDCSHPSKGVALEGTVQQAIPAQNENICCDIAAQSAGYTFKKVATPTPAPVDPTSKCTATDKVRLPYQCFATCPAQIKRKGEPKQNATTKSRRARRAWLGVEHPPLTPFISPRLRRTRHSAAISHGTRFAGEGGGMQSGLRVQRVRGSYAALSDSFHPSWFFTVGPLLHLQDSQGLLGLSGMPRVEDQATAAGYGGGIPLGSYRASAIWHLHHL